MDNEHKPYISADKTLPEVTVKAFILGAILSAANAYSGLFARLTV